MSAKIYGYARVSGMDQNEERQMVALRRAWRNKEIPLREAAQACSMPESTFYSKAKKAEREEEKSCRAL